MANIYSYERISTKENRNLQTFNRQTASIEKYCKDNNISVLLSFYDDASGKDFTNRKQWNKLEQLLQSGDTVIFKDISRFTREAENGFNKYMELMNKGVNLVFLDNPTVSTAYINQLLDVAKTQNLVVKTSLESIVKLLLIVELDRVEQERLTTIKRIKDGITSSTKKSGRPTGAVYKMNDELKADIEKYLADRSVKLADIMRAHDISRNTLKKYISQVQNQKAAIE